MTLNNIINNRVADVFIPKTFILGPPEIKGAFASPVPLIFTPGPNKIALPYNVHIWLDYNSIAYTGGGTPVLFPDTQSNGMSFAAATITNAFSTWQGIQQVGPGISHLNQGWNFTNNTAPFATGDSNLYIHILYRIWSMT